MLDQITKMIGKFLGNKSEKDVREMQPKVDLILEAFDKLQNISNDELRAKTAEFKARIAQHIKSDQDKIDAIKKEVDGDDNMSLDQKEAAYEQVDDLEKKVTAGIEEVLEEILPEAFAVVKETARRFKESEALEVTANQVDRDLAAERESITINGDKASWSSTWMAAGASISWDMVHYDVQLIGGMVLHQGNIAEMATGEGKTLVATLPVYLNALPGRGVHLVTVNNYLAKRDAEWMGPIFEFHGLTVDCIDNHQPNSEERREAYRADVTYGTNNEFGFDYLRDNMTSDPASLVQRKHNYSIVDEVDSVLIDDARTPLIISGPTPGGNEHEFKPLKPRVEKLVAVQRKYVATALADAKRLLNADETNTSGKKELEENHKAGGLALLRAHRGLPKHKPLIKFLSEPGIRQVLQKTENYYLQDQGKEMHKVDQELYFVIEEKQNSIDLTEKGLDLITDASGDPNFFILPDIGMEVNALEKSGLPEDEFAAKKSQVISEYSEKAERVHTVNQLLKAYTLFELDVDYVMMDNKVKIVDEQTGRIMEGRRYSDGLHQAIEAKENAKIEAATQTYATVTLQNFFRMYSKLSGMTGTAETESAEFWEIYKLDVVVIPTNRPITRDDREDLVYKTTREKYNAVIEEIVTLSQAGRPVLVGTTSVEISELLSRMLKIRKIDHSVLNAKLHQREAEVVAGAGNPGAVTIATNMAGRGTDIKLTEGVKAAGGLAIVGTERHDSRRVDRQLRGRAGRQGDPGSSQFFVSLEDNLMRLFGSDRIAKLMDRLGLEEGEVIQHSMITKSIERAQRKVEENNFGVRKRLLEYDDVMNSQREVIYKRRRRALFGQRMGVEISNAFYDVCQSISVEYQDARDYEGFKLELFRTLSIESPVSAEDFVKVSLEELTEQVFEAVQVHYKRKSEFMTKVAAPALRNILENEETNFENIEVPFTDGKKTMTVVVNLRESAEIEGRNLPRALERNATLAMIDSSWKEHLREMDDLRQSVQNAQYEQKDPLLIYKFESFKLFEEMIGKVNKDIVTFLNRANLPTGDNQPVHEAQAPKRQEISNVTTSRAAVPLGDGNPQQGGQPQQEPEKPKPQPVRVEKKVGRNDPCPCGSGRKYKQCHGK